MVHGDVDPWRKKCESYGFLLAKSMVIMNAELRRERMKPKNIIKNIGRDQWEYANDRVIGTGRGWNYNVMDSQLHQPRVRSVGRTPEQVDDSLMRETAHTGARETTASFGQRLQSPLTEANVVSYADFANLEVLQKEFALGKDLLQKAIDSINNDYINSLRGHRDASDQEISAGKVFVKMLSMLGGREPQGELENWEEISQNFDETLQDRLNRVPDQIEDRRYDKDEVDILRDDFKMKTGAEEDRGIMRNVKEFLCEAFCLIEIVEEMNEHREKALMVRIVVYDIYRTVQESPDKWSQTWKKELKPEEITFSALELQPKRHHNILVSLQVLERQCALWDLLTKWEDLQKDRNSKDQHLLEGAFMTTILVRVQTKG